VRSLYFGESLNFDVLAINSYSGTYCSTQLCSCYSCFRRYANHYLL